MQVDDPRHRVYFSADDGSAKQELELSGADLDKVFWYLRIFCCVADPLSGAGLPFLIGQWVKNLRPSLHRGIEKRSLVARQTMWHPWRR